MVNITIIIITIIIIIIMKFIEFIYLFFKKQHINFKEPFPVGAHPPSLISSQLKYHTLNAQSLRMM